MLRTRIIPVLLISDDYIVKTTRFSNPRYIGDPINIVRIFNEKEVDEAITNDDLLSLEKKLPKSAVNAIKLKVDSQINNAVKFAEDSDFPEENEIHDNVYG